MSAITFNEALADCPFVAILRGVRPGEVLAIGATLVEAGFRIIEVPLNSPDPLESIARLAADLGGSAVIGAGTVTSVAQVAAVASAGGRLIVSPHCDADVVKAGVVAGMATVPGVFTTTEAFAALAREATALKLFPAEAASPEVLKALRAVLPPCAILPVGGITPQRIAPWLAAGAAGFGLGGALYRPGSSVAEVRARADAFVAAWRSDLPGA